MGVKLIDLKGKEKLSAIAPVVSHAEEAEELGEQPVAGEQPVVELPIVELPPADEPPADEPPADA